MNKMIHMTCYIVLCLTAILMPVKATAQSDDDKKFLAMLHNQIKTRSKLSKVAVQKATDPAVKAFAEKMIAEHTKMTQGMKPFAESWGLTPPSGPDEDAQKELDKLDKPSGKDFDKEYIDIMVSDHSKALQEFTKEAKDTKDTKFRAVVIQDKTAVAAHKNMAYDLKKKL